MARTVRPNFKALGKRMGPRMKAVSAAVAALNADAVARYEATGALELDPGDGQPPVALAAGDLDVVTTAGAGQLVRQEAVAGGGTVTVALDTTLDDALRAEGLAREVVNRVQNLRKDAGLDVADRIALDVAAPAPLAEAVRTHAATIQAETLAVDLTVTTTDAPGPGPAEAPGEGESASRGIPDAPAAYGWDGDAEARIGAHALRLRLRRLHADA